MKIMINEQIFNLDVANTFYKRLKGLIGKKEITQGMLFTNVRSIHTFFMQDMIDVLMLDKDYHVIYFQKNVSKNKLIIQRKAYYTIELPKNSLTKIKLNDKIIIHEKKR